MFQDPQFWIFIAFIIFVIVIFNPVKKILILTLDTKISEIKKNIDDAEKIKNDAQHTLSEIGKKQSQVSKEIEKIDNDTASKIIQLEKNTLLSINDQIRKRKELAETKIEQMTLEANLEIKNFVITSSIQAIIELLKNNLSKDEKQNLIEKSFNDLNTIFKN